MICSSSKFMVEAVKQSLYHGFQEENALTIRRWVCIWSLAIATWILFMKDLTWLFEPVSKPCKTLPSWLTSSQPPLFAFTLPPHWLQQRPQFHVGQLPEEDVIGISQTGKISDGQNKITLKTTTRLRVNDMHAAKQAVLAHLGLGLLPEFLCQQDQKEGKLVHVLPQWVSSQASFHLVYPSKRLIPPRTQVVIDYLIRVFQNT